MGEDGVNRTQKPSFCIVSRATMKAKQERLLHVGRCCPAGFGLMHETLPLPGTKPEAEKD